MLHPVARLLRRFQEDERFAEEFFSDPDALLANLDIPQEEREALRKLDREAVMYMVEAADLEPTKAPEHSGNTLKNRHLTLWLGLCACVA